jgi:Fe-S-cluster containining protein
LSVGPVEAEAVRMGLRALPEQARMRVRARGLAARARGARGERGEEAPGETRCALLEDDGSCAIYAQRPLVCRSQGQALRYPAGFVPEQAVRLRTKAGDVTWCPLNYNEAEPRGEDVLDAERVDQILAVVTRRHVALTHGPAHVDAAAPDEALLRIALSDLAAHAD